MATLEQIQAKMKQLQAQADALISKKAQAAVDQIRTLMLKHGLTTEDIEAKAKAKRQAKALKGSASSGKTGAVSSVKAKTVPKYRHPKTGALWTGRGRAPAWIAEVKDRSKFLIAGGGETTVAASAGAVSKAKTAVKKASKADGAKGQPKGPQPAKYNDPKSGATWSGRGPAPTWLAGAKDRSKFLIDGAGAAADVSASTETKPSAKKAVAKKAVGKKVAVTKTAPTKKVAMKKTVAKKAVNAKAPAKKALRKNAAVTAPMVTVESAAESTT
ncbi:H-NS family nucleoid-associated regulatory protein [Paraburkholderia sediminicola]|uniref:H-NS family nucleoid-associated regulatory protein n=1 Tax=Paraburkholderia sediminicola TaxID=458836 RepID=UPI0038B796A4